MMFCVMISDYFGLSDEYVELLEYLEYSVSTSIDVSNCLDLLTLSHKFGHKELKKQCLEFIVTNHTKLIGQKEWDEVEDKLKSEVFQLLLHCEYPRV